MANGLFITLEGIEGSGKSTQAATLVARLRAAGREVVATREPGGTPTGEMIRDILQHHKSREAIAERTEALLFAASRAQHVGTVIRPALDRGAVVVCDRFLDSTLAYQGYGRGMNLEDLLRINRFAVHDTLPDLTLLFDLDVSSALSRLRRRHEDQSVVADRFEKETEAFHQRVRDGFLVLAGKEPGRYRKIDATLAAEAQAVTVWTLVSPLV